MGARSTLAAEPAAHDLHDPGRTLVAREESARRAAYRLGAHGDACRTHAHDDQGFAFADAGQMEGGRRAFRRAAEQAGQD